MTIVPLKKVTFFGASGKKEEILDALQNLGCLHINALNKRENLLDKGDEGLLQTREALNYLKECQNKLKPIKNAPSFDPATLEKEILKNKHRTEDFQDLRDVLLRKIAELTPWGDFVLPDLLDFRGHKFWFYIVPNHEMKKINLEPLCAKIVHKDNQFSYVVIVAEEEPAFMPGKEVKLPVESLSALQKELEETDCLIEDHQLERVHLTRWLPLFEKNLFLLENQAVQKNASHQTYDQDKLFALQGWIPSKDIEKIKDFAKKEELALKIESDIGQEPPTLLNNNDYVKGGEDLLSFYMTPNYSLWDPSTTIFFSFALFFAMIFSDAGYSLLLGAGLMFFWKRLGKTAPGKRFRNVLIALTLFSFLWGILVGSYFGISPSKNSNLSYLKIFDMSNYKSMMMLAIGVGIIHILIANGAQAWVKRKSLVAIAHLGWALSLIGGVTLFLDKTIGFFLIGMGLLAVIFFTSVERPLWKRVLKGLMGLTRITGMFGDVLSYLRLFALGLASASLAGVFNDLAKQVYQTVPGFKIIFALLIILIGHGINFVLSLMGGFIHGLRLNYIEFFNWGLPEEGTPFKAFSKKEMSEWNP